MNREIKFRGKRIDNNEWIYGYLVEYTYKDTIYANGTSLKANYIYPMKKKSELDCLEYYLKVVPETIGQYTGLKDKNGIEIYEGDILETCENYGIGECWLKYEVKYNKELAQFILFPVIENGKYNSNNWDTPIYSYHEQAREIIGNIYENEVD